MGPEVRSVSLVRPFPSLTGVSVRGGEPDFERRPRCARFQESDRPLVPLRHLPDEVEPQAVVALHGAVEQRVQLSVRDPVSVVAHPDGDRPVRPVRLDDDVDRVGVVVLHGVAEEVAEYSAEQFVAPNGHVARDPDVDVGVRVAVADLARLAPDDVGQRLRRQHTVGVHRPGSSDLTS